MHKLFLFFLIIYIYCIAGECRLPDTQDNNVLTASSNQNIRILFLDNGFTFETSSFANQHNNVLATPLEISTHSSPTVRPQADNDLHQLDEELTRPLEENEAIRFLTGGGFILNFRHS